MDGFTGINVERACQDIENFYHNCDEIWGDIGSCFNVLFWVLEDRWASPVAKEYTTKVIPEYEQLLNDFKTQYMHIASGAAHAAASLAITNGGDASCFSDYYVAAGEKMDYSVSENNNVFPCEENKKGAIGMDTEAVRIALEDFRRNAARVISIFNDIPNGIAFYDANGQLVDTYNNNIRSFKEKFTSMVERFASSISSYTETETNNILIGKRQAQEQLSA